MNNEPKRSGHQQVMEQAYMRYAKAANDASSLQIRLETDDIKEKISSFLKGEFKVYTINPETKKVDITTKSLGRKKVNDIGYQAIMSFIESVVNRSTVMGNFETTGDCYDYLRRIRRGLIKDLWINMHTYDIKAEEFNGIITTIFGLIEPFMTRTIGDGERGTIRETTIQNEKVVTEPRQPFNPLGFMKTR